jgi:chromate transporter
MSESQTPLPSRAWEVFLAFLVQGFTAFGGPVAHVGYFRRAFVERRAWLSEEAFADLLAMSQFLPGPASSELGMAIGMRRAGYPGLLAAWLGFTLPAGAAMIALAYLTPRYPNPFGIGVLHGLQVAAAAVVLQAVVVMARTLAVGPIKAGMAIGAATGLVVAHGPLAQVVTLAAGAVIGLILLREPAPEAGDDPVSEALSPTPAIVALCLFAVLLGLLPFLAALTQDPDIGLASVLYRTGALVFGGGHAVLPLLQNEIVNRGWIGQEQFLAGYGAVQALPGPLFSFAGFVGAETGGWRSGLVALAAIFLPGLLLVAGVLPFWDRLKGQPAARAAVGGVNAVVVGVLAAALWNPVLTETVRKPTDWALVAAAYVFLAVAKLPPWLVVAGFALAAGLLRR